MNYAESIKSLGLKQNYIADLIGVSPQTLNHFLRGIRNMDDTSVGKLEEILKRYSLKEVEL